MRTQYQHAEELTSHTFFCSVIPRYRAVNSKIVYLNISLGLSDKNLTSLGVKTE